MFASTDKLNANYATFSVLHTPCYACPFCSFINEPLILNANYATFSILHSPCYACSLCSFINEPLSLENGQNNFLLAVIPVIGLLQLISGLFLRQFTVYSINS